jgi:hypothetical protein
MPKLHQDRGCPRLAQASGPAARSACACLVVVLSLLSSGCLFKKQPRVFYPPPVAAKVTAPDRVPVVLPDTPDLNPVPPETGVAPPSVANLPTLPAPPTPKPPAVKPKPPEPAPVVVETPPAIPTPAAKPEQIYSVEERRVYSKAFEDGMTSVTRSLARIDSRKLTPNQLKIANQVKALQSQAEQIKSRDLATALDLVHRADLLAKDLVARLP